MRKLSFFAVPLVIVGVGWLASRSVQQEVPKMASPAAPSRSAPRASASVGLTPPTLPSVRAPSGFDSSKAEAETLAVLGSAARIEDKHRALKQFLRTPGAHLSERKRADWAKLALELLRHRDLSPAMAARLGAILEQTASPAQKEQLERAYTSAGQRMSEGERIATVEASSSKELLLGAVGREGETELVKESALGRLARTGQIAAIEQQVFESSSASSTTRVSALQALGENAADEEDLKRVERLASKVQGQDEWGRSPSAVANVAIAESQVLGKSGVLLQSFLTAYVALGSDLASDESITRAFGTAMALARAIWTDEPSEAAATLALLQPFLDEQLAVVPRKNLALLQALLELGVAYADMCATQPAPACQEPADARWAFHQGLVAALTSALNGTALMPMASRLRVR